MRCVFRGRRSTLETSIVISRGRRNTLDVLCGSFFCESHCQGCVKCWQRANSAAGVAFCDMCWKLTEASHEASILRQLSFGFVRKTRRQTLILRYKVWKFEEVSHEMLVLMLQHVSSDSLVFLWHRRVCGGSCKTSPFRTYQSWL